jgi:hypothetical protein
MKQFFTSLILAFCFAIPGLNAQDIIAQWDFEANPLVPTAANPSPSAGIGTASVVGSMGTPGSATGSSSGCIQASGTGAWQIGSANPGSSNESSGVQFLVPTTGYKNIVLAFDHRISNTGTRTSRIQYTLDGTQWINLDLSETNYTSECAGRGALDAGRIDVGNPLGGNVSDGWGRRTIDFSSISGANDNPNFGVRIVAAHYALTGQFRQANNVTAAATAGTWRFDNITLTGTPKTCIQITEYMYSGANGEFIEFTNVCQSAVDMSGWSFDDDSRIPGSFDLSAFGIVQAGESVILTEAPESAFRNNWNLCPGIKIIGGLSGGNNLGRNDEINLYDAEGNLVDRLSYGDQNFPGTIRAQNVSGWVSVAGLGQNDATAWTSSIVGDQEESYASNGGDIGSPGKSSLAVVSFDPCDIGPCILITEYMYQGANGEFVEFTNVCNFPVNMNGWSFDDDSRIPGSFDLSAFGTVQAGESVILTENSAANFRTSWNLCDGVKIIGGLAGGNNLGRNDEINLYDQDGNLVDRLTYGDLNFPGSIRTQNVSGWVSEAGLGQNNAAEWTLSAINDQEGSYASAGGDIGSPGKSTLATVFFEPCVTPPCILITEYMYQGAPGEFVEFTNVCTDPVDMSGWSFDDDSRTPGSFDLSAFGIVEAGESVLLTEAAAETFRTAWELCPQVKIIGGLSGGNNLGRADEINLYDQNGNLVDRLTYGDQNFPGSIRTQNISGWVTAAGLGANNALEWVLSTVGDQEGSYANGSGIIGSPGKSTRATVDYNPCDDGPSGPCATLVSSTVTNESCDGAVDGSVSIVVNSELTLEYSIDGVEFHSDGNFTGLSAKSYLVTTRAVEDHTCIIETTVLVRNSSPGVAPQVKELNITPLSQIALGNTEVVAFDPISKRVFSTNGTANKVDIIDLSNPAAPSFLSSITVAGNLNSVAVCNGKVAIAVAYGTDPGEVLLTDTDGNLLLPAGIPVGALPDMVTFTPDCSKILTANEGEPNSNYTIDPEGSVSIIDISNGVENYTVATADFKAYIGQEDALRAQGIRIFGPGANAAQDFEPEYIAISEDGATAYVTLQENNAIAIVDIASATVVDVKPLGFKDHSLHRNAFDPSDRDGGIRIQTWPVKGMYQPDACAVYTVDGQTYVLTANEGDARVYPMSGPNEGGSYSEELRVSNIALDPVRFLNAASLSAAANLGRLRITNALGDFDQNGKFEEIYAYGARSFSIWSGADGSLIYDSGSDMERITAVQIPALYNSELGLTSEFDQRSDNKGPEPEAISVTRINGNDYAFIGLERTGGFMVYNVSIPSQPYFVAYVGAQAGDAAPEDVKVIPAELSPNGNALVLVANEVSGTISIYEVNSSCSKTYSLTGNAQGGSGTYTNHAWEITGGSANGASIQMADQAEAVLDLNGLTSSGTIEITYTVTDANGCVVSGLMIFNATYGVMAVTGNNQNIANGSELPTASNWTNMGSVRINTGLTLTYAIENTGCTPLQFPIEAVTFSGADADRFVVLNQPQGTLLPGEVATFDVRFSAPAFGVYSTTVLISSDATNNPYSFAISAAVSPAIIAVRGNGVGIPNGSLEASLSNFTDFGQINWGANRTRTFAIFNTGTQNLNLTGNPRIAILDDVTGAFSVSLQPNNVVTPGQNRQFQVRFDALTPGVFTATVLIENSDLGASPYTYVIQATVLPAEMEVRGNNLLIENNSDSPQLANFTDFGVRALNSNTTLTYYVRNNGPGILGLTGSPRAIIDGQGASQFTVTTQPVATIGSGASSIMRIRFTPTMTGVHMANVRIENNDPNNNPYRFAIQGSTPGAMQLPSNEAWNAQESTLAEISVYPNPVIDLLTVDLSMLPAEVYRVEILSMNGILVDVLEQAEGVLLINTSHLIPGAYQLRVVNTTSVWNKTFIKTKQ